MFLTILHSTTQYIKIYLHNKEIAPKPVLRTGEKLDCLKWVPMPVLFPTPDTKGEVPATLPPLCQPQKAKMVLNYLLLHKNLPHSGLKQPFYFANNFVDQEFGKSFVEWFVSSLKLKKSNCLNMFFSHLNEVQPINKNCIYLKCIT